MADKEKNNIEKQRQKQERIQNKIKFCNKIKLNSTIAYKEVFIRAFSPCTSKTNKSNPSTK